MIEKNCDPEITRVTSQPISILVTNSNIRWVFVSMSFMWFCISGSYYAIMILMKDAKGNVYYVYMFMYVFEIVANILSGIMMETPFFGRKRSLTFLYSCAITFIILIMLYQYSGVTTLLLIILRFFISMIYNINYVYSTEFYPTDIRAKGFALNAVFGRIGAILTPFLVEMMGFYYFIFLLTIYIIAFLLTFLLKETYNTELEQYIKHY